jgi:hypothetical protein
VFIRGKSKGFGDMRRITPKPDTTHKINSRLPQTTRYAHADQAQAIPPRPQRMA